MRMIEHIRLMDRCSFPGFLDKIYLYRADSSEVGASRQSWSDLWYYNGKLRVVSVTKDYSYVMFREVRIATVSESYGGALQEELIELKTLAISGLVDYKIII